MEILPTEECVGGFAGDPTPTEAEFTYHGNFRAAFPSNVATRISFYLPFDNQANY